MTDQGSITLCHSNNVQAFFDNELDASMTVLMRAHMTVCNVCAAELRALQQLHALMGLAFSFTSDLTMALHKHPLTSH